MIELRNRGRYEELAQEDEYDEVIRPLPMRQTYHRKQHVRSTKDVDCCEYRA
jgi:hypothetical protein